MLNDFVDPKGLMPLEHGDGLFEPHRRLLAAARSSGARVIWVCDTHAPDDREFDKRAVHCLTGTWAAAIVPATSEPIYLSAGDLDEAIVMAIASADENSDANVRGGAFEKIDAFRQGVLGGLAVCSTITTK